MAVAANRLDQLISTTFDKVRPVLVDQITNETPLFAALNLKSKVTVDGGTNIVRPLMYALNDTVGSYSGYDILDTTPQTGFGNATYTWKSASGTVTISGEDVDKNSGEPAFINLVAAKLDQLRLSLEDMFNTMLWSDGTGNSSKDFLGIRAIVDDTGTLGGIDSSGADGAFWRSIDTAGPIDLTELSGIAGLNHMYNSLAVNRSKPDFEFTDQTNFEAYENLAADRIRFTSTAMADLGFESLAHKRAEVVFEPDVPSGQWFFLNSNHLEFVQHRNTWMRRGPFIEPANQDAKSMKVLCRGNLITDCRRAHGVIRLFTTS